MAFKNLASNLMCIHSASRTIRKLYLIYKNVQIFIRKSQEGRYIIKCDLAYKINRLYYIFTVLNMAIKT